MKSGHTQMCPDFFLASPFVNMDVDCQDYSEFHPHEKAIGWKKFSFRRQICEKWAFLEVVDCQRFAFSLHFSSLLKLCFEGVRAMLWGSHLWQMSGSKATNGKVKSHKWHAKRLEMAIQEAENGRTMRQSIGFIFLEWTNKLTKICRGFSK